MIIDTSALMAIVLREPEADTFGAMLETGAISVSAATQVEAEIVVHGRRGIEGLREMRQLFIDSRVQVIPVDEAQARLASDAYRRFGRGSGHPARLNYGDCFSYALAVARDEPLLFKGDDFVQTDVRVAA